jgi:hypothetical protein
MIRWFLIAALSAGLALPLAMAQEGPPPPPEGGGWRDGGPPPGGPGGRRGGGPGPDAHTRELLEQVMLARLSKELTLDDEQTVLLVRRFAEYKDEMRTLQRDRAGRLRALDEAVRGNADADAVEEALEAVLASDARLTDLKSAAYASLGEGLTAWQRGRLYLFINEFEDDMRRLVQQARDRARMGGEGPGMRGPRRGGPPPQGGEPADEARPVAPAEDAAPSETPE